MYVCVCECICIYNDSINVMLYIPDRRRAHTLCCNDSNIPLTHQYKPSDDVGRLLAYCTDEGNVKKKMLKKNNI